MFYHNDLASSGIPRLPLLGDISLKIANAKTKLNNLTMLSSKKKYH